MTLLAFHSRGTPMHLRAVRVPVLTHGEGHAGAIYNATGPESFAFLTITDHQLRAGLTQAGLPVEVVNIVIGIQTSFAAGAFDIVTGDVERLGGRLVRTQPASDFGDDGGAFRARQERLSHTCACFDRVCGQSPPPTSIEFPATFAVI